MLRKFNDVVIFVYQELESPNLTYWIFPEDFRSWIVSRKVQFIREDKKERPTSQKNLTRERIWYY